MPKLPCDNCKKKKAKPVENLDCIGCALPTVKKFEQYMEPIKDESAECQCTMDHPCCQIDQSMSDNTEKPKPKCCPKKPEQRMPNRIEITRCEKPNPPHPCDPIKICDPCNDEGGECKPALCREKLKNPAFPGEITRCKEGAFIKVQACIRPDPPHPCDIPECIPGLRKRQKCPPAALCYHRIKNPQKKKPIECPNDTYEAYEPKTEKCVVPGSAEDKALKKHCAPKLDQATVCKKIMKYYAVVPKDE